MKISGGYDNINVVVAARAELNILIKTYKKSLWYGPRSKTRDKAMPLI